ncbi:MAG: oligopeptidase A [Pseudomonadales bacterium]|nr:oligopeptidase A [Pseudomonadales bacterium]MCP5216161.1 oligopeptidase A [Pseudomonadales bacterium]
MTNVLLLNHDLPPFQQITPDQVQPAIAQIIAENRQQINELLDTLGSPSWNNLVMPLDELNDRLNQAWSPVQHMNSVVNSSQLRDAYNACLPLLSEYSTELGQSPELYQAFKALANSEEYAKLSQAQRKHIDNTLRDFHLAGVDLPKAKKQRYAEIKKRLSELSSKFSENVLDATQAWSKLIEDAAELAGVPESALAAMQQAAKAKGKSGYLITLEFPSYFPLITYGENAALREEVYRAYVTRASDVGPNAGTWDNSALIDETLALRHELAELLGFENYVAYSLATKMAESPQQVMTFLTDLAQRVTPLAKKEYAALQEYANTAFGVAQLNPWDVGFYSEKLRQHHFAISQEALRPYFPADHVISGMFVIVNKLFAIDIEQVKGVDCWHPDVRFYHIYKDGQLIGKFYLDIYARENKRGGAWMDDCRVRRRLADGRLQLPVAYLTCNFNGPVGNDPALLTHNEVTTLFHEFGHGLHHLLTQIEVAGVSGINGVPWDAVELPSQFMENWCWQPQGIALISQHYQSGEPLPDSLLQKMLAAKNFQTAMQTVRQLEFSLFDFKLHLEYQSGSPRPVQELLDEVREQVAVTPTIKENRFQHGFSHIFAGGYSAGYYSYKWAEVLSADAFSRFEDEGIFNPQTGKSFLTSILEQGGSDEPMRLFVNFRGREPEVDALLKQDGLSVDKVTATE